VAAYSAPGLLGVRELEELIEQCERTQELAELVWKRSAELRRTADAPHAGRGRPDWPGMGGPTDKDDLLKSGFRPEESSR